MENNENILEEVEETIEDLPRVNQKEELYNKIPVENRPMLIKVLNVVIVVSITVLAGIIIGSMVGIL